jgi:serine/threonine-protein kinase mTOR
VLEVAAHAVGVLARACNAEVEVVEVQFADPAIEWLKDKQHETRRYAAVLVLRELALAAPTVLYDRRRPFFEDIWLVINDMKENIRYVHHSKCQLSLCDCVHARQAADNSRYVAHDDLLQ